jgi:hypothetical protein
VPATDDVKPFSPAEAAQIRAMFSASSATVVCPRCRGGLKFTAHPGDDPATEVWQLECGACKRTMVVKEKEGKA